MNASDIRGLSAEELKRKVNETEEELFQTRLQNVSGALENTAKIRDLRRSIARVKTVLNEKSEQKVDKR